MRQQIVRDADALSLQVLYGSLQVDGIPVNNSRGDEAQARCTEALVLKCAVTDFTLPMKEYSSAQRVAGFAFF